MGIVDNGLQNIQGRYYTPISGKNIGSYFKDSKTGIYRGMTVSRVSGTEIQIGTGVFIIDDSSVGSRVLIETATNINPWVVDETKPFVVFSWTYADTTGWYADLSNKSAAELLSDDVVICMCQFFGGALPVTNTFNMNRRSDARYAVIETYELNGTKDGSNLVFTLPVSFPDIRYDQYYISYNGAMIFKDVSYTVSDETTSGVEITLTIDAPQLVDDLRAVVISH